MRKGPKASATLDSACRLTGCKDPVAGMTCPETERDRSRRLREVRSAMAEKEAALQKLRDSDKELQEFKRRRLLENRPVDAVDEQLASNEETAHPLQEALDGQHGEEAFLLKCALVRRGIAPASPTASDTRFIISANAMLGALESDLTMMEFVLEVKDKGAGHPDSNAAQARFDRLPAHEKPKDFKDAYDGGVSRVTAAMPKIEDMIKRGDERLRKGEEAGERPDPELESMLRRAKEARQRVRAVLCRNCRMNDGSGQGCQTFCR
ncbi:MAG: hypothetical protein HY554_10635 [Elusimicrobia bacterium]|nr:hypothetical protein [Elusimicrobiota bacterium]